MIEITSVRLHHHPHGTPVGIFQRTDRGRIETGRDFFGLGQLRPRNVVFQQRIAAGDGDPLQPPHDAIGQFGLAALGILDQHGLIAADLLQNPQAIGGQRAAGLDQVDDRVGHAQRDHDLDRAGERDQVGSGRRAVQKRLGDVGKAGRHAVAGQAGGTGEPAILGHAQGQAAFADFQIQPVDQLGAALGDQIAAGDAHVDGPFGTQDGNVLGAQKGDVDRHFAATGEQAPLLPAETQAGLFQQFGRHFGQTPLAGDSDS